MTARVDDVDALRRRVVNVVGHALRTPVTTLCGMADELARTNDPAARAVLAEAVRRNGAIVEHLLDDLLLAAGVTTVLPTEPAEPIAVAEATRAAWARLGMPGELSVDGDATALAPPPCVATPLQRLLDNAARYGSGTVRVTIARDGDDVLVRVASTGDLPGADDEVAHYLEPFYRGEHAVMKAAGLGVGLPVALALARHAGGDVAIAVEGDSVVASLRLPAA